MHSAVRETRRGWAGSMGVHACLVLLLLLTRVDTSPPPPEFVEVALQTLSSTPGNGMAVGSSAPLPADTEPRLVANVAPARNPVNPPTRIPSFDEDVLPVPQTRKEESTNGTASLRKDVAENLHGQKETGSTSAGEKSLLSGTGSGGQGSSPLPGSGGKGSDVGRSVGYSMEWGGGGSRRLLSGDLPAYPEGVNLEAQVRLEAIVTPEGRVASVRPTQKADTRLENAALTSVRKWVFEPLPSAVAQRNQTCLITFNYHLR